MALVSHFLSNKARRESGSLAALINQFVNFLTCQAPNYAAKRRIEPPDTM